MDNPGKEALTGLLEVVWGFGGPKLEAFIDHLYSRGMAIEDPAEALTFLKDFATINMAGAKILAEAFQQRQQQTDDRVQQLNPSEITELVRVLAAPPPPEVVEDTEGQGHALGFGVGEPSAFDDFGGPLAS